MTEPNCPSARRSLVGTPLVLAAIVVLAAAASGCSSAPETPLKSSNSASCAVVIEVAGSQYIGGRQSDSVLPVTKERLEETSVYCDDTGRGHTSTAPTAAFKIRGVPVSDAVAADGYQLLLSERLWRVDWKDLPTDLQPYVARAARS